MRLKSAIERELGIAARVRAGAPGSFNVFLDGEPLFSKKQSGRMPGEAEIIKLVRERASKQ